MQQLLEALQQLGSPEVAALGLGPLITVLLVSLASSLFVAYLYQIFYRARATGSQVYRAFPLMGISITAIFISVQFSLPLSLGLLGALSIVRFRTPIKEPEELIYLFLAIAAGLGLTVADAAESVRRAADWVSAASDKCGYANVAGDWNPDGAKAAERWWFKS